MNDRAKKAAAVAAVMAYIKMEEEAAVCAAVSAQPPAEIKPSAAMPLRMWGISGRQTQMQLRNLMQIKAFHGSGLRQP